MVKSKNVVHVDVGDVILACMAFLCVYTYTIDDVAGQHGQWAFPLPDKTSSENICSARVLCLIVARHAARDHEENGMLVLILPDGRLGCITDSCDYYDVLPED